MIYMLVKYALGLSRNTENSHENILWTVWILTKQEGNIYHGTYSMSTLKWLKICIAFFYASVTSSFDIATTRICFRNQRLQTTRQDYEKSYMDHNVLE